MVGGLVGQLVGDGVRSFTAASVALVSASLTVQTSQRSDSCASMRPVSVRTSVTT